MSMDFNIISQEDVADILAGSIITGVDFPDEETMILHTLEGKAIKIEASGLHCVESQLVYEEGTPS